MRRRPYGIGPLEIIVIAIGLVVAVYTGWVIKDVSTSEPDVDTSLTQARPPSPSPSAQVAPPGAPTHPPALGPFREAASEARTILVIGDSTGTGEGSWVDLVAEDLGEDRLVTVHEWDEGDGQFDAEPTTYGEAGEPLDLWNLSYRGVDADYPERMTDLPQPDAVLLNIGHDRSPRAVERAVVVTMDAVGERWGDVPTAFILQNPSTGGDKRMQARAIGRLTTLASEIGYPVIDVYGAFQQADVQELVDEDSRPNEDGVRLWADVVGGVLTTGSG